MTDAPRRPPTPVTCACGSTNVQTGGKTADGLTACRCRACGATWAEVVR